MKRIRLAIRAYRLLRDFSGEPGPPSLVYGKVPPNTTSLRVPNAWLAAVRKWQEDA